MKRELLGVSVLVGLLSTTSAQALTSAEVWQAWKDMATSTGQTVATTSETQQGDTLVVAGVTFSMAQPDANITSAIDELRFKELGDGRVEISMSPVYSLTVNDVASNSVVKIAVTQTNLKLVAAGDKANQTFDLSADSLAVATTEVTENGAPLPVSVNLAVTGATGQTTISRPTPDTTDVGSNIAAASVTLAVSADDGASVVKIDASVQQFSMQSGGAFGAMIMSEEEVNKALAAGLAANFGVGYGPVAYTVDVVEAAGPVTVRGKADGGSMAFAVDKVAMTYKGGAKGVEVIASGAQIPFPEVALRYAESVFDFAVPMSKSDTEQPFNMTAKVIGATISDEVWGMFDPAATLPRDPATVILDTNGTTKLFIDLTDETAMDALAGGPPGSLESLNLPELKLAIAGAELTGTGGLTFDNTDLVTFQGMPAPTGKIDFKLVGGNGLLDKLIQLGYVPEEEAMGVRMMLGMFARPGEGPDTLTSTIEFKDKGLFANGMQLQ